MSVLVLRSRDRGKKEGRGNRESLLSEEGKDVVCHVRLGIILEKKKKKNYKTIIGKKYVYYVIYNLLMPFIFKN